MSFDALCWARNLPVKGLDRLVMYELAQFAGQDDACFPSLTRLADECGIGRSTLIEILKRMEQAGYVAKSVRRRDNGSHSTNNYILNIGDVIKRRGVVQQPDHPLVQQPDHLVQQPDPLNQSTESVKEKTGGAATTTPLQAHQKSERFTSFWDLWPKHKRKVDKAGCQRLWESKHLDDEADAILRALALAKQSKDWTKSGGEYIPEPIRWLRKRYWDALCDGDSCCTDEIWAKETV